MRVFDLASLPTTPQGSTADGPGPLMLTTCVREASHQAVFEYWARCVGGAGDLPRVQVDWRNGLLPASRRLLERLRDLRGRDGVVVSVHVLADGVDLDAVGLTAPLVDFDHLAIRCSRPATNGRLRRLAELSRSTLETVGEEWQRRATTLGVDPDAWRVLAPHLRALLDPAEIVEAANALAEVQLEGLAPDRWVDAVRRQLLVRLMGSQSPREFVALIAVATAQGDIDAAGLAELHEQDLVRDGQLVRWAAWLKEATLIEGLFGPGAPLPTEGQRTSDWVTRVEVASRWIRDRGAPEWASSDLSVVAWWIESGELDSARETLDLLALLVDTPTSDTPFKADFFLCLGRLRMAEHRTEEAVEALREGLRAARAAPPTTAKMITHLTELAGALWGGEDTRVHAGEVETLLREVLGLEEANASPTADILGTLFWLSDSLDEQGRWREAVEVAREAVRRADAASLEDARLALADMLGSRQEGRAEALRIWSARASQAEHLLPGDVWHAHLRMGDIFVEAGDLASAEHHYAAALEQANGHDLGPKATGKAELGLSRVAEAEGRWRVALRLAAIASKKILTDPGSTTAERTGAIALVRRLAKSRHSTKP